MTATLAPLTNWDAVAELFVEKIPGFAERAPQTRLAHTIEDAFVNQDWLLAQAGTGVGKSYGGLVPAILWALQHGETVAVATATKALQTQYSTEDLPRLAEIFAEAGMPFTWAVLKGRGSYSCVDKINSDEAAEVFNIAALKEELETEGHTGDLDDLVTQIDPRQTLKIVSTSDECPGKTECSFGGVCFVEKAREKAQRAHIVVVNHSLLIADTLVRLRTRGERGLLPELGGIVVDEAHELCSYASSALGSRLTRSGVKFFGRDAAKLLGDPRVAFHLDRSTDELFSVLTERMGRSQRSLRLRNDDDRVMVPILQALVRVKDAVEELAEQLKELNTHGDDKKKQARKRMLQRARSLTEKVIEVATAEADVLVRWISKERTRDGEDVVLEYAPLQVGEFLNKNVWHSVPVTSPTVERGGLGVEESEEEIWGRLARKRAVVLMSATLAVGSDFSFLARELGLDSYQTFDAGTPFNYAKQAAVWIPRPKTSTSPGFADPTKDVAQWRIDAQKSMKALIEASGGRTLVLFTSRVAMLEAKTVLEDFIVEDLGLTLLVQGEGTNRELADTFRRDETSVLFGMNSFMTGLNVPGDALRTVILDKVPFTSPDDVLHAARCEAMDRDVQRRHGLSGSKATFHPEGSFFGRSVPEANLVLLQAVGRGIRTLTDEALLAVLDPRLLGKPYGKKMLAALPPAKRLETLREAKDYLADLGERRD